MSKSTIRNFILVLVVLLIFSIVVGWSFVLVNKRSQLLEEQIAAVASQTEQQSALARLQTIARQSEPERDELNTYFLPQESDIIAVLSEVETLAPRLGITLKSPVIKPEPVAEDNHEWIEIVFSGTGSRSAVESFLSVLEEIPYVSRVTSVSLNGEPSGVWETNVTLQVQLLNTES